MNQKKKTIRRVRYDASPPPLVTSHSVTPLTPHPTRAQTFIFPPIQRRQGRPCRSPNPTQASARGDVGDHGLAGRPGGKRGPGRLRFQAHGALDTKGGSLRSRGRDGTAGPHRQAMPFAQSSLGPTNIGRPRSEISRWDRERKLKSSLPHLGTKVDVSPRFNDPVYISKGLGPVKEVYRDPNAKRWCLPPPPPIPRRSRRRGPPSESSASSPRTRR